MGEIQPYFFYCSLLYFYIIPTSVILPLTRFSATISAITDNADGTYSADVSFDIVGSYKIKATTSTLEAASVDSVTALIDIVVRGGGE